MTGPRPKKHLGQNFLRRPNLADQIVRHCQFSKEDVVIEIGPGHGVLTGVIAPLVRQLICVEKDKDLIADLRRDFPNVAIVQGDFLTWPFPSDLGRVKVIGNIPYNISTPIIERLIEERLRISGVFLTVQEEFGLRLAAKPGGKDYGSLSCFVQYYSRPKVVFRIPRTAFKPVPKVDSVFVHLDFHKAPVYQVKDEALLFRLIRTSFTQRRKNMLNAALSFADKPKMAAILNNLGLDANSRPEQLNMQNFVDISNQLQ